ncbi:MAG TPA: GNAT family N-acetyltransferase [Defluviitaleaceae bacterium]|nr:GNAT family N-acetyltransferase [Candidatus Epulonipiscium sp.]HOQ17047.1 GNAT family N-acetyltransferase [Defluviitaleaceae bacterium]HPT75485.1 GNAT family N-acetyltransferase [Defluviitaleaceae bacterium]HQD49896.1 GNAT family N-acetyltransferase [Defluviitaleaceae bacterium]
MEVRSFNDDYHEVGQLVINYLHHEYDSVEEMKDNWKGKNLILKVAEDNGKVIGFGALDLVRKKGEPNSDLYGIVVDPAYRRQGVGTLLMKSLVDDAKGLGIRYIYSTLDRNNEEGINFLIHCGFEYKRSVFMMEMNEPVINEIECPEGIEIKEMSVLENVEEFLEVYEEIFGHINDKEQLTEKISKENNYNFFLMYRVSKSTGTKKIIGFCIVENIDEDGINRRIDILGVIDKYARRGLGKVLYITVLNHYWSVPETKRITISLKSSSENVKKFYLSCGMEETYIQETYRYEIL